MSTDITPSNVVAFWKEAGPEKWFAKEDAFDAAFHERFAAAHFAAARRELDHWAETPEGALALLILLDQFPRNCFRGTAHAFATDPLARMFAVRALDAGFDRAVENDLRRFFYLPLQHAEDRALQDRQLALFQTMERPADDRWAEHHHAIIERFGRFPHRNRRWAGRRRRRSGHSWKGTGSGGEVEAMRVSSSSAGEPTQVGEGAGRPGLARL